jgi:YD repeat-containing protein
MKRNLFTAHCLICVFFLISGIVLNAGAQNVPAAGTTITNAIPPSPDAAALGKFGAMPVGLFSGVPKIDIPLYTIKSGDLNLPLSISYHASGIKIEEMASSVGLGWAGNFGGSITRTIRGLPDEAIWGMLDTPYNIVKADSLLAITANGEGTAAQLTALNTTLNHFADGSFDGEPDVFNYNFSGYSGKFVLDSYGNVYVIPRQKIKFTFVIQQDAVSPFIQSFTAVTPDGVTYVFGSDGDGDDAVEFTNTQTTNNVVSFTASANTVTNKAKQATAWFIKKIISPTGHQINFTYKSENFSQQQLVSANQLTYKGCGNCTLPIQIVHAYLNNTSVNTFYTVKLTNIAFENGNVSIVAANPRQDQIGATSIDQVVITNTNSALNKTYNFYYKDTSTTRLRLDSLIGILPPSCSTCANNHEKYSFQYYPDPWTNMTQNQNIGLNQDYWGYYNASGNTTLVPSQWYSGVFYPGANRAPNEQAMMGGTLYQVNYPTGGYSVFTYEANHEAATDFGGISASYPATPNITAMTNDTTSIYYGYDANNGNPNNLVTLTNKSGQQMALTLTQTGLHPSADVITSVALWQLSSAGADSALVYNLYNLASGDTIIYLNPGKYQLVFLDPKSQAYPGVDGNGSGIFYTATAQWVTPNPGLANNYIVGGLRIKQVADYDGVNPAPVNLKTYQYTEPSSTASSGHLNGTPGTYSYILEKDVPAGSFGGDNVDYDKMMYFVQTATSNVPLGTSQGSVVGYDHALEVAGRGGLNGQNEYYYSFIPDLVSTQGFPFCPAVDQNWMSGILMKEINWRQTSDTTYAMVKQKVNNYSFQSSVNLPAIKAGFNPTPGGYTISANYYTGPMNFTLGGGVMITPYYNNTNFYYLASDTTKVYDLANPSNYVTSYNSYGYDTTTYQLNQRVSNNSKNELITESVLYPDNYAITKTNNPALLGILNLQNSNIWDVPVEEITQKSNLDGSNLRTVKAVLTTYKPTTPLRDSIFESRSVMPITGFTPSSVGPNVLNKDPSYQPVVAFNQYDAAGNIEQEQKVADALHSYIWGYPDPSTQLNTYPIAEVINADTADIAYTNFEGYGLTGYGNWTYGNSSTLTDATAPMGAQCYNIAGGLTKTGLTTTTTYVVSFWAKAGSAVTVTGGQVLGNSTGITLNGWQYHEYDVIGANSITVGGSGFIDEVRLYPITAQMTTYTYVPLVGIASACNARSQISYYQYDAAGRLVNVTDQYGNIVKNYAYHYQGQ